MRRCEAEGCERVEYLVKNLCSMHYSRWKRLGSLELSSVEKTFCGVDDCSNTVKTNEYCRSHHYAFSRYGDPLHVIKKFRGRGQGVRHTSHGYIAVQISDEDDVYSVADKNGYAYEHRLVMANHLGRKLSPNETIHHINGDRSDNRVENLQLRQGAHGVGVVRQCNACGSNDVSEVRLD